MPVLTTFAWPGFASIQVVLTTPGMHAAIGCAGMCSSSSRARNRRKKNKRGDTRQACFELCLHRLFTALLAQNHSRKGDKRRQWHCKLANALFGGWCARSKQATKQPLQLQHLALEPFDA